MRFTRRLRGPVPVVVLAALVFGAAALAVPRTAAGQAPGTGGVGPERAVGRPPAGAPVVLPPDTLHAYADEEAGLLLAAARKRWLERDRTIRSYEALVRRRVSVQLRTPLKDRTLYRAESASRVSWRADGPTVVRVLAANVVDPSGPASLDDLPDLVEDVFDPGSDRISFGLGDDERDGGGEKADSADSAGSGATDSTASAGRTPTDAADDRGRGREVWIRHPLAPGSEAYYRFRSGDTLSLSLGDGRTLRAVELVVVPRKPSVHLLAGSLWIEPSSGALVRALYRVSRNLDLERDKDEFEHEPDLGLLPGIFRPVQFQVSLVDVDYALWSFRWWLPRRMRIEGSARAGVLKAPAAYEIAYRILDVKGEADSAASASSGGDGPARPVPDGSASPASDDSAYIVLGEPRRRGRTVRILAPRDTAGLRTSDRLPPPIGEDAPGFASAEELQRLYRDLSGRLLASEGAAPSWSLHWGPQRADLLRYNRVEGLSVGVRGRLERPVSLGSLRLGATARLGIGTWVPGGTVEAELTRPRHRLALSVYDRVEEVDPRTRSLGPGNSATALLFGRDDGDYFRAEGGRLEWSPAGAGIRRPWYAVTLSAEHQMPLPVGTQVSLPGLVGGDDAPFRPALDAADVREYAAALRLSPWWGSDPGGVQGGLDLFLQGAVGDRHWGRGRLAARVAAPLPLGLRIGVEAAGGAVRGGAPPQRLWFLGGARTLRGYAGAAAVGPRFVRGRFELARGLAPLRVSVFSDAGWAGDAGAFDASDALVSAGAGVSVLDGLVRADLARALRPPRGWRVELYVDAAL